MGRTAVYLAAGACILASAFIWSWVSRNSEEDQVYEPALRAIDPDPPCPWRDPEGDLRTFFPGATRHQRVTKVLSDQRLLLQEQLGHPADSQDLSFAAEQVFREDELLGMLVTRRVKGEHGAIEFVLAIDSSQKVRALRFQRLREPKPVADALQDPAWLSRFAGRTSSSTWQMGSDIPNLPPDARRSAEAVLAGVRSSLVLLAVSQGKAAAARHHE